MRIDLVVNGQSRTLDVDPARSLLGVLRGELALTGTKYGCGEGECGACTVLLGTEAVHSCLTPVSDVAGRPVTTIEGLEQGGELHPVQQAFLDEGAMQCGYCTPGMIMAAVALLGSTPRPSPHEIARALEGNVCRCGTHPRVVAAVQRAAVRPGGVAASGQEGRS
jgi:aerobic-type carbon monoxide dehydrogenase small subunit (CoxS/CutS family)